jgi:hypothetical protein
MKVPLESATSQDVFRANNLLAFFRGAAFLLIKRTEITYLFLGLAVMAYGAVLIRVAVLFAFLYIGIGKLDNIPMPLAGTMIDSLAMPFSFTFFPHQWAIQLSQLIQTGVVISLGFGALRAWLKRKLEFFQGAARDIWSQLDDEAVRQRMTDLARIAAKENKAAVPTS